MAYVVGVDAGNTKTVAPVARLDGTVVGAGYGGCGDIYGAPSAEAAMTTVSTVVADTLREAGTQPEDLLAGAFGMAGADWPEDFAFLRERIERRGFGNRITVVNDAVGALRAGSPDGTGVAVVCGTFVAIAARAPDGLTWHHSWWQESGGGRELGARALRAVYRAELGIDPQTRLKEKALSFFGEPSVEEILYLLTRRERADLRHGPTGVDTAGYRGRG